ncbi:hypothetical protein BLS_008984 [Venturia inaequalis]|uniref:Protein CSN12 homolog n=1 Tax=Venturia inaequalis TaxID=5025 RepID=A0A8H3YN70_VENIN|nr:hypothetical protein BLS_008984 [Venturia inaequalis]KAE9975653.1 hypothetical protein EG328_003104 [Venturia inaequalis]KAE9992104.1 hypothetical protein EG327_010094 [Venturia inaequalis]RDI82944.1 Phospholipase [Venturia inaequalis]
MDAVLDIFREAYAEESGYKLAESITPVAPADDAGLLYGFYRSSSVYTIQGDLKSAIVYSGNPRLQKQEAHAWVELYMAYWKAIGELLAVEESVNQGNIADWKKAYDAWKDVLNALLRGYQTQVFAAWTIPCLYVAGKYLRNFAIKADDQERPADASLSFNEGFQEELGGGKNECLQDAARQVNRIFSACISDRAPLDESRKWGIYYVTNLLFKIYFKLGSLNLAKNPLRSIAASSSDMPPLDAFPKSHQVTFNYYSGVISFLDEDYAKAERQLSEAWNGCHKNATKNLELILTYLVPCHLITSHKLPTATLLGQYPQLQRLFGRLISSIKLADLAGFDAALLAGESEFVKRRIYLTLERGRDVVVRNLMRKVFIIGGYETLKEGQSEVNRVRRTRIPVAEFAAAVRLSLGQTNGEVLEDDEVECMLANMIYKGLMKGYISRERSMVVLSKGGAFPGTGV